MPRPGPLVALVLGVAAPAQAQVLISPHVNAKLAGDVETERAGAGVALGDSREDDLTLDAGAGMMHQLNRWLG